MNQATSTDELEQLRLENAELKLQLKSMAAMATLGELTGTATHEFNNVLMTVLNYAKLGLRNRDDANRDKALNKILDATQRAAKITNTILAQARNRSESPEPIDLCDLVSETLVLLSREMQKYRITVETSFESDSMNVHAVGNQLSRLLINLLINARQAIDTCGNITVSVRRVDEDMVELAVRDSGCGIPAESLPKIFESKFTTKSGPDAEGRGGTGLGLAACKEIVDGHRGRIRVESTVGVGTMIAIRLPVQGLAQTPGESSDETKAA
ncbi:MAG: ATP-binding protein [Planctomycetota bacterium]